jgi:7,8-dihydro-6-hydroxymethylpterin-pyrophosphokinase
MGILIGIESGVLRGMDILKKSTEIILEFTEILVISSVIRSTHQDQDNAEEYLSVVLKATTSESPETLIKRLIHLEQYFLREYFSKYFRAVLLAYSDQMSLVPHLLLPHPQLVQNRAFLIGSVEIWGNYNHPILEKQLNLLLKDTDVKGVEFISPGKSLLNMRDINFGLS